MLPLIIENGKLAHSKRSQCIRGYDPFSSQAELCAFSKKSGLRSTCLLAGIIRILKIHLISLGAKKKKERKINLKPTEMNTNIMLNHHHITFLTTLIWGLKPGLVQKKESSKLLLYPQLCGHMPAQLFPFSSPACVCVVMNNLKYKKS